MTYVLLLVTLEEVGSGKADISVTNSVRKIIRYAFFDVVLEVKL